MSNIAPNITVLVETFAFQIAAAVEEAMAEKLQAALAGTFGASHKRGPGSPPKQIAKQIAKYREERTGKPTTTSSAKPTVARKIVTATPKVVRARKLQGQYLGALKSLTGAARAKVKATAKNKSVAEAVKLALSLKKT